MVDVGICLLRRSETGGVGHRTGHDSGHRGDGHSGDVVERYRDSYAEDHHEEGEHVEPDSAALEAGEESGADLEAYAVDEQDEAEFLEELKQVGVERHAEVAERDSDEQNPGHAEADAGHLDFAHYLAQRYHEGQNDDGVCYTAAPGTCGAVEESVQKVHKL